MISSTPIRKSTKKQGLNDSFNEPFTPVIPDDDSQRRKRRSVYDVERRLSNIPENSSATPEDMEDIKNHLNMCQKLFNENKINTKNAWDMRVIDYMNRLVSNNVLDSDAMLTAATNLDVCVKIYGCRVEFVGQEIVKLTHNTAATNDAAENGEVVEDEQNTSATPGKRTKTRKKRNKATIAKDKNSLFLTSIPKLPSTYFTGNIDINANNYDNMFTNKIPMNHAGYTFNLLNNVDCGFISYGLEDKTLSQRKFPIELPKIDNLKICAEFKNFNVDEVDDAYDESIANMMQDSRHSVPDSIMADEVVYDKDGFPVPELDGSMHDIFADDANGINDIHVEEQEVVGHAAQRRTEMIVSFSPKKRTMAQESTLRSSSFMQTIWVGPSHWKNRLVQPLAPRFSGKDVNALQAKVRKSRAPKAEVSRCEFKGTAEIDFKKICKSKKKINNIVKVTLPPNDLITLPDFDKLMLMNLALKQELDINLEASEFEHSPFDYNNANDSQYCSQVGIPNDDIDDIGNDAIENDVANNDHNENNVHDNMQQEVYQDNIQENGLVDAPDMVTQTYVPYAMRAKKVNMKRLKQEMWHILVGNNDTIIPTGAKKEAIAKPVLFSEVYKTLPSKLPKKVRSEISVPLAYFTLLHLTNDHNLKLTQFDSLEDVNIEQLIL